ncbi:MAG TPA: signal peptide peptidase SppA [Thermoanaerobaculia bacterium]
MAELDPNLHDPNREAAPVLQPLAPRKKSRAGVFFVGAFSGCLLALLVGGFLLAFFAMSRTDEGEFSISGSKVAIVPIEGEIVDARDTVEALHRYADNSTVRAIVMRINSPGGAIAPSQEIYETIRSVRASSGKPIVASLDSVAASGGFYIAAACDRIVANPGSITGSIGVILQWMETKDLIEWAKIKPQTITAGAMKDIGSPYRDMTDAERAYLQSVVAQLHSQFIRAVAAGRKGKMTEADVAKIADGRIFTGEQALSLKLVDSLGNLDDAVRTAAKLGGVHGKPATIYPRRRKSTLFDVLSGSGNESRSTIEKILGEQILNRRAPRFLFQWPAQ